MLFLFRNGSLRTSFVFLFFALALFVLNSMMDTTKEKLPSFMQSFNKRKISNNPSLLRQTYLKKLHDTVESSLTTTDCSSTTFQDGLIIVNVLGLLANDLFQVAFANLLSRELCWPVVYRKFWNAELPSARGSECFPHARVPQDETILPISTSLQHDVNLTTPTWKHLAINYDEDTNNAYLDWAKNSTNVKQLQHLQFDFTGNNVDKFVQEIQSPSSSINVISMEAFFIHYDWMRDDMGDIRRWLTMSDDCCQHSPPANAVVMHVRDFEQEDTGYNAVQSQVYIDILQHYYYNSTVTTQRRPLWIVCQPKTRGSQFVQHIVSSIDTDVTIVTGDDQYDAFCTLTRASTLVLSYVSSYSQMAALLSNAKEIHYPVTTLYHPQVTLQVPGWTYHLINSDLNGIQEWDVGYERINPTMA